MPIYRYVKVIIQNNTDDMLIASGSAILRGNWVAPVPTNEVTIEPQSTHMLQAQSEHVGVGVEGYVRFGTTQGYIRLYWNRPWVGKLVCYGDVENYEGPLPFNIDADAEEDEPAFPVVVFKIHRPHFLPQRAGASAPSRTDSAGQNG